MLLWGRKEENFDPWWKGGCSFVKGGNKRSLVEGGCSCGEGRKRTLILGGREDAPL